MGNQALSKQTVKQAINHADKTKLKKPAKMPNLDRANPINQADQAIKKQYTYLRQVEKELERQQKKRTPAPVQTSTSWGQDPWQRISDEEKEDRKKKADEIIKDTSLAERLRNVGSIDDNFKVSDMKYGDTIQSEIRELYASSYEADGRAAARMGRSSGANLVNIIHNYKSDPLAWSPESIADHTKMRTDDVKNLIDYYDLLDEDQVYFEFPKEGIRWSEVHQLWFTGQEIDPEDSKEEIKRKLTESKPLLSHTKINQARQNVESFQKIDKSQMEKLKKEYYINDDIYREISTERDPNDRFLLHHSRSPSRYNTDNLIDKLEQEYKVKLGERQIELIRGIEEKAKSPGLADLHDSTGLVSSGSTEKEEKVKDLLKDIDSFEKNRRKVLRLQKERQEERRPKHVGRFSDDAGER